MELVRHHAGSAIARTWIAPAISRTVIGADAGKFRDFRLHTIPVQIGCAVAVLENHRWTTRARAVDMQSIATEIDQLAGWMELRRILLAGTAFIAQSEKCHDYECHNLKREYDPESTSAMSRKLLISAHPSDQESHAQSEGDDDGEHNSPTHRMKTGCDPSLREAGVIRTIVVASS